MSKKTLIGFITGASLVIAGIAFNAYAYPVTPVYGGGTQTSTVPAAGQVLVGNSVGTYNLGSPVAGVVNAVSYAGSDIGAKINAAEAALCSLYGGGTINLPAGQLPFTTSIVIATCPTQLVGAAGGGFYAAGGTTLLYSGTGTAYTYNVAGYSSAGIGIFNLSLIGPAGVYSGGLTGIGSSTIASSYGIRAGGSNGEFGFNINGVQVSGFGTALYIDKNASFLNMTNSVLQKNGRNIDSPQLSGANGENMRVSNSILADSNSNLGSTIGASISNFCVDVQTSGNVQWTFQNTSFDDCQVYSNQFGGTSNVWNFSNDHFEDPNTGQGAYDFIAMQTSTAATAAETWNINNSDFMQDFTSGAPNEYIQFGGTLNLSNVVGDINNNVSSPMQDFATPLNGQTVISWNNLSNKGFNSSNAANTGFTNVYASTTFSQFGIGFATSTPAVAFTTSTILFQGASSTIKLGVASKFPGCIELYDAANSSTVNYIYSSSTALVDTATKPSFCQ